MGSVTRHFFNKFGPDRIITIEGDACLLGVRHVPSQRQFRELQRLSLSGCEEITLRNQECLKVRFYQAGEDFGTVTGPDGEEYVVTGAGEVRIENPETGTAVLKFGVGGPPKKTQVIFTDVYEDIDAAEKYRDEHGICVNRQGKDTRISDGKEVLGDIAFI